MLADDLRGIYYITLKDLRAYYLKPPNLSWGILLPLAFILAFAIRSPGDVRSLVPGLLGLTILFGTSSMEAIVIVFERRIGSFERLLLAPVRLPAILGGKLLAGMAFGLSVTSVVLVLAVFALGIYGVNWLLLAVTLVLSAAAFAALGALVSVSMREVFEAQTLANFVRFPMIFLGGVFTPLDSLPIGVQVVAHLLPLTYSVDAFRKALSGISVFDAALDLVVLAAFAGVLFTLAVHVLAHRLD